MKGVSLAFAIYALGTLAIFLLDVFITTNLSAENINLWGTYKAELALFLPIASFGLTMTVIKDKQLISDVISLSMAYTLISIALTLLIFLDVLKADFLRFMALFAVSGSFLLASALRSQGNLTAAQLYLNLWRFTAIFIIFFLNNLKEMFWGIIFISIIFNIFYCIKNFEKLFKFNINIDKFRSSIIFMISSFVTGYAVTFELFWITKLGSHVEAAFTLSIYTIFLAIATIGSGFVGFSLAPILNKSQKYRQMLFEKHYLIIITIISVHFGVFFILRYIFDKIYDFQSDGNLTAISLLAMSISILRFLYTIYTAVFVSNFQREDVMGFTMQCGAIALTCSLIALLSFSLVSNIVMLLFSVNLMQWLLRCISAHRYAHNSI